METRAASVDDAEGMGQVLREIIEHTGRQRPHDVEFVMGRYITNPTSIRCTIAIDEAGNVVGFQSLKKAAAENPYDTPEGWGIIGTHISPKFQRQGVGKLLFLSTREAALQAGLEKIDAYIGADNPSGLKYYDAMGFQTYRTPEGIVQKVCSL
ncbi:GNAT family N-acetyltransferase [Novosphingobium sp. 1949]|uniref:GNAT family N-acetyltransferase n=1 Tax=Novosphingobium organovorum TaxID=2930092 RepID=A0ABT0BE43_9SPHN|nr:GNAT family N-acetyltransferase [Novosphingobium organovorum]MCJ2183311.1 GNAT family N-acetyltransferase [Novosphingobium organovorum]